MIKNIIFLIFLVLLQGKEILGQSPGGLQGLAQVSDSVFRQLEESLEELASIRAQHAKEALALSKRLNLLDAELIEVKVEYQNQARSLERGTLDLVNLEAEIKARKDECEYLTNLFSEYVNNLESHLHISEFSAMLPVLTEAKNAEDGGGNDERFTSYQNLLSLSLRRIEDLLGGRKYSGRAVDGNGNLVEGVFGQIGPIALFKSLDNAIAGLAVSRLGSIEASVVPFKDPSNTAAVIQLLDSGSGNLPLDPSGGNAYRIESTNETFIEHIRKGGPVMIPIGVLAGLALLVGLYKWLTLAFVKRPSIKKLETIYATLEAGRIDEARQLTKTIRGPIGVMIGKGVANLKESKELVEEAMYEVLIQVKMNVNRLLPFIAIAAAAAPLLGLLGTVTGIINTFKMITIFGSGDVKSLSGGISEALITTKFGLIVAIPALLIHAFLARKAKGIIGKMEMEAVSFMNHVSGHFRQMNHHIEAGGFTQSGPDYEVIRRQVNQALKEVLGPLSNAERDPSIEKACEKP